MSEQKNGNVFPVDVKQFAEMLGIEESTAYGMLRFCHEMSLCEITKRPQPQGKKGKPATIYLLDAKRVSLALGELLVKKFDKVPVAAEFLAHRAANDNSVEQMQMDTQAPVAAETGNDGGVGSAV